MIKVATSNGITTKLLNHDNSTWRVIRTSTENLYSIPIAYSPNHLKVIKVACKLFLSVKMPGFINDEERFKNTVKHTSAFYKRAWKYKTNN